MTSTKKGDQAVALSERGFSAAEIAEQLEMPADVVARILRQRGVQPATRRTVTQPGYTQGRTETRGLTARQRDVLELVTVSKMSVGDIAERLGLLKQQVSRTLEQLVIRGELRRLEPGKYEPVPRD